MHTIVDEREAVPGQPGDPVAPSISRRQAWCKLAVLIADGLPEPRGIDFLDPIDPTRKWAVWMLDVVVDDASALWRWAEALGAEIKDPRLPELAKDWHQKATCDNWHGYDLTVKTYHASTLGVPAAGFAAVRAVASVDVADAGSEVAGAGLAGQRGGS